MRHTVGGRFKAATLLLVFLLVTVTAAEEGVLVLVVTDVGQHPFPNIRIGTAGDAGSPQFTDQNGKARLRLAAGTKPAALVTLLIMGTPNDIDLAFISPYDGRVRVPPFDNEQENFDPIIVVKRGDRATLESGEGMLAIHATANKAASAAKPKPKAAPSEGHNRNFRNFGVPHLQTVAWHQSMVPALNDEDPRQAGIAVAAEHFGLSPAEVEAAIADWGGDPLLWKLILLKAAIENGGTDPFPSVKAANGDVVFGIGSWSLARCTLQPLLLKLQQRDSKRFAEIAGADTNWLLKTISAPCEVSAKAAAARMLASPDTMRPEWRERFRQFGFEPAFQRTAVQQMGLALTEAQSLSSQMGFASEQAVATVYDTIVQAGPEPLRDQQQNFAANLSAFQQQIGRAPDEQEKLLMLANQLTRSREQASAPQSAQTFVDRVHLFSQGSDSVSGQNGMLEDCGIGFTDLKSGEQLPLHNNPQLLAKLEDGWTPATQPLAGPLTSPARGIPQPASPGQPLIAGAKFDPSAEAQITEFINRERAKQHVPPLQSNQQLTDAARAHTAQVAKYHTPSHQLPGEETLALRYVALKVPATLDGENVTMAGSAEGAHSNFMHSPHHRDAILNPEFNAVGIGAVWSGGVLYVTEDFARLAQVLSNQEAAKLTQQALANYAAQHGITLPVPTPSEELQQKVCDMAAKNAGDLQSLIQVPGARGVMAWSTADPARLNGGAVQSVTEANSGYSLAACYVPSKSGPGVLYWLGLVTY